MCNALFSNACSIQVFFKGFAFAFENDALRLEFDDFDGSSTLFDGYAEYPISIDGDVFVALDIKLELPKADSGSSMTVLEQVKGGIKKATSTEVKRSNGVTFEGNMFAKLPDGADGEQFYVIAAKRMILSIKAGLITLFDFSIGSAFVALRLNSETPECEPDGFFASLSLGGENTLGLGPEVSEFLAGLQITPEVQFDFGVTFDVSENAVDAIFVRIKADNIFFMGLQIEEAEIQAQFFSGKEFNRRKNYNVAQCCEGKDNCGVDDNPLTGSYPLFLKRFAFHPPPQLLTCCRLFV